MTEQYENNAVANDPELRSEWIVRVGMWCYATWRPLLGWAVLLVCMALASVPALLLQENDWLRSWTLEGPLLGLGPLAVVAAWLCAGWRGPLRGRPLWLVRTVQVILFLFLGAAFVLQMLGEWWPGLGLWWQAASTLAWTPLWQHMVEAWQTVLGRLWLWWLGVQQNNAARDDLVLAGIAGVITWLLGGAVAVMARRFRSGLPAGVPILWPVGFVMLYSPAGRWVFVLAVALTLLLHLLLDQQALLRRWQAQGLDYSPSVLVERGITALGAFALVLSVAALTPNLYVYEVTARYYEWLQPVNERMEGLGKRLFPGLTGVVPWQARGLAGGLPNAFLLGAGSDLGQREVMRVRTNEQSYGYYEPPQGHPLRAGTFALYDGLGWDNAGSPLLESFAADEAWADLSAGRRPLLQSINLNFNSSVIYAAGEPQSASVPFVAQQRFAGDLIALTARTGSYTAVSQIPALDENELDALPPWGEENPLPPEYAIYLALPDTVTQRTRDLAAEITAGQPTMYAQAQAIEEYLRQIPYDLEIGAPPAEVADVADYFLFDLRRGYCDYYATAFVVLARLAGLPTRFVTGFAPGNWLLDQQQWVITEAEAHSWPEVYFDEVGWVRFEPTAYRPQAPRIGLPDSLAGGPLPTLEPLPSPEPLRQWLPLWWAVLALVPLAAVGWGVLHWRRRSEDPWLGLLRWGQGAGRPLREGETTLEYGSSLADYVQEKHAKMQEMSRTAAREVQSLSREVSAVQYAPEQVRAPLRQQAVERWSRLRQYLRRLQ
jgi:transglutaminase-like putative cysteine protease